MCRGVSCSFGHGHAYCSRCVLYLVLQAPFSCCFCVCLNGYSGSCCTGPAHAVLIGDGASLQNSPACNVSNTDSKHCTGHLLAWSAQTVKLEVKRELCKAAFTNITVVCNTFQSSPYLLLTALPIVSAAAEPWGFSRLDLSAAGYAQRPTSTYCIISACL